MDGHGRFRAPNEPLGLVRNFLRPPEQVRLANGPVSWFRMMPVADPGRTWPVAELEIKMHAPTVVSPMSSGWHGFNYVHGSDGYGVYAFTDDPACALAVVFAFTSGETWSIDTFGCGARQREKDHSRRVRRKRHWSSIGRVRELSRAPGDHTSLQVDRGNEGVKGSPSVCAAASRPSKIFHNPRRRVPC